MTPHNLLFSCPFMLFCVGACWGKPVQGVLCRPVMKNAALDYFLPPPFSPPKNGKKEH